MITPRPAAVPSWCAPRLRIVTPEGRTAGDRCVELPPGDALVTIGRDGGATIRLIDPWTSRRHAMISVRGGRLELIDMGSRWGTRLNATELTEPQELADGDSIVIGATAMGVDHAWKGPAAARLAALRTRERSDDGLPLFDSASRRLPMPRSVPCRAGGDAWEQWTTLAATVLLAVCAALLAWRLVAGH